MIKIPILTLLVTFLCCTFALHAGDIIREGGLGSGKHFPYELTRWQGKEQLITKLTKGGEVYEFVRVSKEEFHVRQAGADAEVFFKFNTEFQDGGVILSEGKLVDLLKTQENVTALMYGEQGYFLIEAAKKAPEPKKGQIYIISKPIRVQNWHRTFVAVSTDYYLDLDEVRYPLSTKIASARLLEPRKMEFVYRDKNGNEGNTDIFFYREDTLFKNGKELRKALVLNGISDETYWLKSMERALNDKDERAEYLKYYTKDELISAFSNASSPEIHKKLIELLDQVYTPPKK